MPPENLFYNTYKLIGELPEAAIFKRIERKEENKDKSFLKKPPNNVEVSCIKDIFQNGPATILVTKASRKVVVKAQNENFNWQLGLQMVLLRYLYDPKIYSDLVYLIFESGKKYDLDRIFAAEMAIVAKIGRDDYHSIIDAFAERNL